MGRYVLQHLLWALIVVTASATSNNGDLLPDKQTCGRQVNNAITAGTKITEYPWMALIFYENKSRKTNHYCVGSLINNRYILTAATCLKTQKLGFTIKYVRLGEFDTSNPGKDCVGKECSDPPIDLEIEETIVHENHTIFTDDVGLLRLAKPVTYSDFIKPICLSDQGQSLDGFGTDLETSGWGRTNQSSNESHTKKKQKTTILGSEECTKALKNRVVISEREICVKHVTEGPCKGDNGGPLMSFKDQQCYQLGIVAFGTVPCGVNAVTVGPRVSNYVNWILSHLKP